MVDEHEATFVTMRAHAVHEVLPELITYPGAQTVTLEASCYPNADASYPVTTLVVLGTAVNGNNGKCVSTVLTKDAVTDKHYAVFAPQAVHVPAVLK